MNKLIVFVGVGTAVGYAFSKGLFKSFLKNFTKNPGNVVPEIKYLKIKKRNDKLLASSYKIEFKNGKRKSDFICNKMEENNIPIFEILNKQENFFGHWNFEREKLIVKEIKFLTDGLKFKNLLNEEETEELIQICDTLRFEKLTNKDIRNYQKLYLDSEAFSELLWRRIKNNMIKSIEFNNSIWKPVRLNERIKFEKYDPTMIEKSEKHHDQSFHRNEREISFLTLLIYLNSNFDGGETNFHVHNSMFIMKPKIGQGIIFPHGIHENSVEYSDSNRCHV
eukprot:gene12328-6002_t